MTATRSWNRAVCAVIGLAVIATGAATATSATATTSPVNPLSPFLAPMVLRPVPATLGAGPTALAADRDGVLGAWVAGSANGPFPYAIALSRWSPTRGWGSASLHPLAGYGDPRVVSVAGDGQVVVVVWAAFRMPAWRPVMFASVRPTAVAAWSSPVQLAEPGYVPDVTAAVAHGRAVVSWQQTTGRESTLMAAVWDSGHGWSGARALDTKPASVSVVSALQPTMNGALAVWTASPGPSAPADVLPAGMVSAWDGTTWSVPTVVAEGCTLVGLVRVGDGASMLSSCRTSDPALLAADPYAALIVAQDWTPTAGWHAPVTLGVDRGQQWTSGGDAATSDGVRAAAAWVRHLGVRRWLVQVAVRDPATGWSAARTVSPDPGLSTRPGVAVSGGSVVVRWLRSRDGAVRLESRALLASGAVGPLATLSTAGRTVEDPVVLVGGPAGVVSQWLAVTGPNTAARRGRIEVATWTARAGWSTTRVLTPAYPTASMPFGWTGAVATTAGIVSWGGRAPRTVVALLTDPRPRGPAAVAVRGRVLACRAPAFVPRPAVLSYRWLRGTTPIAGATRPTFVVPTSLLRTSLRCRVVATTQGLRPGVAYSGLVRVTR